MDAVYTDRQHPFLCGKRQKFCERDLTKEKGCRKDKPAWREGSTWQKKRQDE